MRDASPAQAEVLRVASGCRERKVVRQELGQRGRGVTGSPTWADTPRGLSSPRNEASRRLSVVRPSKGSRISDVLALLLGNAEKSAAWPLGTLLPPNGTGVQLSGARGWARTRGRKPTLRARRPRAPVGPGGTAAPHARTGLPRTQPLGVTATRPAPRGCPSACRPPGAAGFPLNACGE